MYRDGSFLRPWGQDTPLVYSNRAKTNVKKKLLAQWIWHKICAEGWRIGPQRQSRYWTALMLEEALGP